MKYGTKAGTTISTTAEHSRLAASVTCLLLLVTLTVVSSCADWDPEPRVKWSGDKIRSITINSRVPITFESLLELKQLGITHLTLVTFGWQRESDLREVHYRPGGGWFTESDAGIRTVAAMADSLDLTVTITPHLWVRGADAAGLSRDQIGFDNEADWEVWQRSYEAFVLHYARLSEEIGSPLFVIGTELRRAATERPEYWRSLIRNVRAEYGGQLTYAANWYGEYEEVEFWDALDIIGVQSYFPLSSNKDPSPGNLASGWQKRRNELKRVSAQFDKAVLFTEIGYRSVRGAAREPWAWAPRHQPNMDDVDTELQASLFTAFFESMWSADWFAGAVVWKWDADSPPGNARDAIDFTPRGKPALDVISRWFLREDTPINRGRKVR